MPHAGFDVGDEHARAILAIVPPLAFGATLSKARIAVALRRAGRTHYVEQIAADLKAALRELQLRQPRLSKTLSVARLLSCSPRSMPFASALMISAKPSALGIEAVTLRRLG